MTELFDICLFFATFQVCMFNLRYNILAIYNVILAGFSSVLLTKVLTFGIYGERYEFPRYVLLIMFIEVVFDSAYVLNQRLLNAEMKFSAPHILSSFQTLFTVLLFPMRFGLYIRSILLIPITNSIRSLFPSGFSSHYHYALRLHQVVGNVVICSSCAVLVRDLQLACNMIEIRVLSQGYE